MKKLSYVVLLLISMVAINMNVSASTTPNGVSIVQQSENEEGFSLYCVYHSNDWILINRESFGDKGDIDASFGLLFQDASNETLKQYYFMDENGNLDCPSFIIKNSPEEGNNVLKFGNITEIDKFNYGLKINESSCSGKCINNQETSEENFWVCNYTGPSGNLTTGYNDLYYIKYPNGMYGEVSPSKVSLNCSDLYYNKVTNEIQIATYDYSLYIKNNNNYDKTLYNFLCGENNGNIEYYCSGECEFPNNKNINCSGFDNLINKNENENKECNNIFGGEFGKILKQILNLIKFFVPILIIGLAIGDFIKAIAAQNQDELKKAANRLVKRLVIGILIFVLPTILEFVLKLAGIEFGVCTLG